MPLTADLACSAFLTVRIEDDQRQIPPYKDQAQTHFSIFFFFLILLFFKSDNTASHRFVHCDRVNRCLSCFFLPSGSPVSGGSIARRCGAACSICGVGSFWRRRAHAVKGRKALSLFVWISSADSVAPDVYRWTECCESDSAKVVQRSWPTTTRCGDNFCGK